MGRGITLRSRQPTNTVRTHPSAGKRMTWDTGFERSRAELRQELEGFEVRNRKLMAALSEMERVVKELTFENKVLRENIQEQSQNIKRLGELMNERHGEIERLNAVIMPDGSRAGDLDMKVKELKALLVERDALIANLREMLEFKDVELARTRDEEWNVGR